MTSLQADPAELAATFALFAPPGAVIEMRTLHTRRGTLSGYFDNADAFVEAALGLTGEGPGTYVTLNPVKPELLARAQNRIKPYARHTTADGDIVARHRMLIDFDAIRPAGISSREAEHAAALEAARGCRTWLVEHLGFPVETVALADSGNGAHLVVGIALPNDDTSRLLVQRCLDAIALFCSTDAVTVDTTVGNAARIVKLYGTGACKGDATTERPHRLSRLLEVPPLGLTSLSRHLLERLAALAPTVPRAERHTGTGGNFDVRAWLAGHHVEVVREKPWRNGDTVFELDGCPIGAHAHHRNEAVVILFASGAVDFKCQHETCQGIKWAQLREHFDGPRDQRQHAWARRNDEVPPDESAASTSPGPEPWSRAVTAATFVAEVEAELDWLETRLLARGSITEWFSPRGLGKTQVALAIAVKLARAGHRVLLLDRDNSRREVRRRLRAWGAADVTTLRVMTRHDVPLLTDGTAWKTFPFGDYELVIIDSFDASTEGVGEQDSAKPSQAIAPLLDIAHRADGPAILVLGNTIKSGTHGRGSGVVEDRADISYEVRDATDLQPTGAKPWWADLPPAGRDEWQSWATRRHRRVRYRLAFVATKFRIGEEPDPFVLEVDLASEPWQLREVTADVEQAGQAACVSEAERRVQAQEAAVDRLAAEVTRRAATAELPLNLTAAVDMLHAGGVPRDAARMLLEREKGTRWQLVEDTAQRGHPTLVVGVNQEWPPEKTAPLGELRQSRNSESPFSPGHAAHEPEKTAPAQSVEPQGGSESPLFSGGGSRNTPPGMADGAADGEDVEVF